MEKLPKYSVLFLTGSIFFLACTRPPDLPLIPSIEFEKVQYVETSGSDSLIVYIHFKDGDGDLGLNSDENSYPYEPYDVVLNNNGDTVMFGSQAGLPAYNPIDYIINRDNSGNPIDTFFVKVNPNHYNYFVHFFKKYKGEYTEFKWTDPPYYQTFDGRFPILNTSENARPLEGTLRYGMVSTGWSYIFRDTMKISVQIQDRALNKSNIVETPDFTLAGIKTK